MSSILWPQWEGGGEEQAEGGRVFRGELSALCLPFLFMNMDIQYTEDVVQCNQ